MHRLGSLLIAGALAATPLFAADLPQVAPEAAGFSAERLDALDARLQKRIDAGDFPGAIVLVARAGEIAHFSALGAQTEGGGKMPADAIFRIYSMTKPITSAVAMMLVEEGELGLADPLSAYLPEFENMTVATGHDSTEPAKRPITIHDLMRHTSGLTYGFFGVGPARDALKTMMTEKGDMSNRELARELAKLPLEHQPGTTWEYSRATDVLGAVIEEIEGKPLGEVFEERVFGPLDMTDTGFWVEDEADWSRLAEAKEGDRNIGNIPMFNPREDRVFESGGGGLVSTAQDYARFAQMLMNGGDLDGVRFLSPQTVAYMTSDHLGDLEHGKYFLPGPGYGFGLGFGVRLELGVSPAMGSVGEYGWGGAAGTYYWSDPRSDMFAVYMMQSPAARVPLRATLRNMVYGAMMKTPASY
jgi:CubicO group peptidase (beta-lactamase class C family)